MKVANIISHWQCSLLQHPSLAAAFQGAAPWAVNPIWKSRVIPEWEHPPASSHGDGHSMKLLVALCFSMNAGWWVACRLGTGSTLISFHMLCHILGEFKRTGGICLSWGRLRGFLLLAGGESCQHTSAPDMGCSSWEATRARVDALGLNFTHDLQSVDKQGEIRKWLQRNGNTSWSREEKIWLDICTPAASCWLFSPAVIEREMLSGSSPGWWLLWLPPHCPSRHPSAWLTGLQKIHCCFWKLMVIYPPWLDRDDILLWDQFCPAFFKLWKPFLQQSHADKDCVVSF